jgi:hypothetical protein
MPENVDDVTAAVQWKLLSSHDNAEEVGLSQLKILRAIHKNQFHPHHYLEGDGCFQTTVLHGCSLHQYTASRKVAGSRPYEVNEIFQFT